MFTVTKEILESCEALVTVEIEETAVQNAMQKAARKIARENPFPGFRKGKVPYAMVVSRVGEDALRRDAAELLLENIYTEVLEKAEVAPSGSGSLEDIQLAPLAMKIRIPLAPVVELRDYSDLRLAAEPDDVTDVELEAALEHLRHEHLVTQPVSRPAAFGDWMTLGHVGAKVEEEVFLHQHDVSLVLDPEDEAIIPGLVAALVGLSAGEEKMFHLTLPKDFVEPELRNADAEFEVAIESVAERTLPALDDAFASVVGNFESLDELKVSLRKQMQAYKSKQFHAAYHEALVHELVARAEVLYPAVLLEEELDEMLTAAKAQIPQQVEMPWEDFLRLQGKTEEQVRESFRPRAIERLTEALVLDEFARQAELTVSEPELKKSYAQLLEQLNLPQHERRPFDINLAVVQNLRKQLLHERTIAELERLAQGPPAPDAKSVAVETAASEVVAA